MDLRACIWEMRWTGDPGLVKQNWTFSLFVFTRFLRSYFLLNFPNGTKQTALEQKVLPEWVFSQSLASPGKSQAWPRTKIHLQALASCTGSTRNSRGLGVQAPSWLPSLSLRRIMFHRK